MRSLAGQRTLRGLPAAASTSALWVGSRSTAPGRALPRQERAVYLDVGTVEEVNAYDRLIETTQELLWDRGYAAMSPKEIQRRSGVGQGSMYHHFLGKADLAAEALRRTAAEMRFDLGAVLDGPGTPLERITAYLLRERDALRGCRIGGLAQDPEIRALPELNQPVADTLGWLRVRIAELIAEGQADGSLQPEASPDQVSCAVCAVVQGGHVLARAQGSNEPFHEAVEGAVQLLAQLKRS
jgi:AcrR family transcriptional regulator